MRKFMLVVSVLIVALMASFVSPISVGAETQEEVFNNAYNYFHSNPLEEIDESQIEEYGLKIETGK